MAEIRPSDPATSASAAGRPWPRGRRAWLAGLGACVAALAGAPAHGTDPGGWRADWADRGIEVGLDHVGDVLAVVDGGTGRGTDYAGLLEAAIAVDADTAFGWSGMRLYAHGIALAGTDPADRAGSIHAPSNVAGAGAARLLEAWVERGFLGERLALLAGLFAADSEFDVRETAGVFLDGGFGTGLDLS